MNVTAHMEIRVSATALKTVAFTRCAFFIFAKRHMNVCRKKMTARPVTSMTAALESVSSAQKKNMNAGIR